MTKKPSRSSALTASGPEISGAVSRLDQDRITDEVNPDSTGSGAFVKVNSDRIRNLLLQIAEIFPLGGDAAPSQRIIPPRHEPTRLFVALHLQGDFFHCRAPIISHPGANSTAARAFLIVSLGYGRDPNARMRLWFS